MLRVCQAALPYYHDRLLDRAYGQWMHFASSAKSAEGDKRGRIGRIDLVAVRGTARVGIEIDS